LIKNPPSPKDIDLKIISCDSEYIEVEFFGWVYAKSLTYWNVPPYAKEIFSKKIEILIKHSFIHEGISIF
jgi:nitric oxide reductase large subunit